jgi:general secretion pathway protein F/type IV pilus assembly protein PilC
MIYSYSGIDKNSGKKVKGKLEALNIEDVKIKLRAKEVIFDSIRESKESFLTRFELLRVGKISNVELATFSNNLAIYLKSGVALINAIKLSKSLYEDNKKILYFLNSIETNLEEGKSFYQSLENQKIISLPAFYKQSIKVSEDGGLLGQILLELARYLKEQDAINRQVSQAFIYPSFIMIVSVLMISFMLTVVVPKITSIFESLDQELPDITKFVISAGDFFATYWVLLVAIIVVFASIFQALSKFNKKFKFAVDSIFLKVPLFGKIAKSSELGRFSYITSTLLKSGVPFIKAIKLATEIIDNSLLREKFSNAASKVVEGGKLSNALMKDSKIIDKAFIQAIALGEETSEIANVLENLSQLYFEQNKEKISVLLSLIEPAIMLFVGGAIGFIITAMLLPIFSMNLSGGF